MQLVSEHWYAIWHIGVLQPGGVFAVLLPVHTIACLAAFVHALVVPVAFNLSLALRLTISIGFQTISHDTHGPACSHTIPLGSARTVVLLCATWFATLHTHSTYSGSELPSSCRSTTCR